MKHPELWRPTKIVYDPARRAHVANPSYVGPGSVLAVDRMARSYERVIARHATGRLLDCGCGDVPYYGLYRDLVTETTCIDWAFGPHGHLHVDQQVDLNGPLPFEAERFETVLLADVLEHVAAPWQLMGEIGRVLAPGGKAIVMVPFLYGLHERPHDYYRYTEFALRHLSEGAGLHPLEVEPYGGQPDVLLDLVSKGLARSKTLGGAFFRAARRVTGAGALERWREKTGRAFPLGYCVVAEKASTPATAAHSP
ncbi:MAG: methyltransferase domain-containing protein [Deltaproteobacteria bacterium]|nr:methyltransferase domain-containing protein [Deltaproteobacteria bacterium]